MQALVHTHSRFGRGRGNGTGPRTATALGTGRGVGWDAAGARKEAVGSLDGVLPPAGDLWMEPVISSSAGACFRAAANFQKREYAEHEDHRSHNAEQNPTARS